MLYSLGLAAVRQVVLQILEQKGFDSHFHGCCAAGGHELFLLSQH